MDKHRKDPQDRMTSLEDASNEHVSKTPSGWPEIAGVMSWVETTIDTDGLTAPEKEFVPADENPPEPDDSQLDLMVKKALIYVVDDDQLIRNLMKSGLGCVGFENVKLFTDGDEVIKAIFDENGRLKEVPDLIISDTEMQRVGGFALYEKIKTIGETMRPLFLALSGNHNVQAKWGDVPFVNKPFNLFELLERVTDDLKRNHRFTKN